MALTNILKALAIIAVVGLHVLAATHNNSFDLNLILRFCVPLFIALSGFGLAKSFVSHSLVDFYFRRIARLLPWYLFWGTIIYLYINFSGQGPATYGSVPLWRLFVFGKLDYHLYFVPMIIQLYLIFPLLWLAVKKFPRLIFLAAFLWQIYRYWQLDATALSDQQQYIQVASWLFYFVLGIFAALQGELLQKKWLKVGFVLLTVGGLTWSLVRAQYLQNLGVDPIIFTRFTQIPILVYAAGFILSGLFVFPKILTKLSPLISLGELSYLMYLNHTLTLRVLTRPPFAITAWPFPVLLLAEVVASALVAKIVQEVFSRLLKQGQFLIHRQS